MAALMCPPDTPLHPRTPHFGLANESDRLRLSIDVRLLPLSAEGSVFLGVVTEVTPQSITLQKQDGRQIQLVVDAETNIRCAPGNKLRVPFAQLTNAAAPGRRIIALHENGRATMRRRPSDT